MKKLILIIAIVFSGMLMQAQEMYLKKMYTINNALDTIDKKTYYYNNNWQWELDSIVYVKNYDYASTYRYENNTLKSIHKRYDNWTIYTFEYYNGHIDILRHAKESFYDYFLNYRLFTDEYSHIVKIDWYNENNPNNPKTYNLTWIGDNIVNLNTENGYGYQYEFEYYHNLNNPEYNEWKNLGIASFQKLNGSTDYGSELNRNAMAYPKKVNVSPTCPNTIHYNAVQDVENNYPVVTELRANNTSAIMGYVYYEYFIITDTPELPEDTQNVISVEYYDTMGRKIDKPRQGFYIERKYTDKGIISKKHYIQ